MFNHAQGNFLDLKNYVFLAWSETVSTTRTSWSWPRSKHN